MNLQQMLDLLPDNDTGEITAADLRAIVTDLYTAANTWAQRTAYGWSASDASPPNGKIYLENGWTTLGGTAAISEVADDGTPFSFAFLDAGDRVRMVMTGPDNQTIRIDLSGPAVDQGNYRELPYVVITAVGVEPANNDLLSVDVVVIPSS